MIAKMAEVNEQYGAARQQRFAPFDQRGRNTSDHMFRENDGQVKSQEQRARQLMDSNRDRISDPANDTTRKLDRQVLTKMVEEWNATRLDIFRLTEPDGNLEFEGNMRFYYREHDQSLATKCIKVKSSDTTTHVIAVLTDKILGDMRMLSTPQYSLYEVHAGSEDNRLGNNDHPLYVQLNWLREDREGRFMLKDEQPGASLPVRRGQHGAHASTRSRTASGGDKPNGPASLVEFVRRVSKRGRKKSQLNQQVSNGLMPAGKRNVDVETRPHGGSEIATTNGMRSNIAPPESDGTQLYREIPESSFHRSISNPEAVMRRRRAQKLERKLLQYRNAEGGPDTGGTLKIFGDALNPAVPYKTLLLGIDETAEVVVRQMLQKYSMEKKDPRNYCIVRTVVPRKLADRMAEAGMPRSQSMHHFGLADAKLESVTLNDFEFPLRIQFEFDAMARQRLQQQQSSNPQRRVRYADDADIEENALVFSIKPRSQALPPPETSLSMPFLVDLETDDRFALTATNIVIGSQPYPSDYVRQTTPHKSTQYIMLVNAGADILPQHCMLCNLGGGIRYSIDVMSPHAQVFVGQTRIVRKTEIDATDTIQLGSHRFVQLMPPTSAAEVDNGAAVPKERTNEMFDVPQQHEKSLTVVRGNGSTTRPDRNSMVDGVKQQARQHPAAPPQPPRAAVAAAVLPATLEFADEAANDLLSFVLEPANAENPTQFALSPAFTLYLAARYRASTTWHSDIAPMRRANLLAQFLFQTANMMHQTVLDVEAATLRPTHAATAGEVLPSEIDDKLVMSQTLAYWLANITELLHFLRNDKHMNTFCVDAQEVLESTAVMACHVLARLQHDIISGCLMPALDYVRRQNASATSLQKFAGCWSQLVQYLDIIANIMVGCCLNGSLIVQFMSLLFQAVNAWCMNSILYRNPDGGGVGSSPLCSHAFGSLLFERISNPNGVLKLWARSKDLLHAVDISFRKLEEVCRVVNDLPELALPPAGAATMPMQLVHQRARQLNASAPSLNSVQLETLLHGYHAANLTTITPLPTREFVEDVLNYAADTTDRRIQHAGGAVVLEEITTIGNYPFTMPDADYGSDDDDLGVPSGFLEFLRPLVEARIVIVRTYPPARSWAVYFHHHTPQAVVRVSKQPHQQQQQQPHGERGRPMTVQHPPSVAGSVVYNGSTERPRNGTDIAEDLPSPRSVPAAPQMMPRAANDQPPSPPPPLVTRPSKNLNSVQQHQRQPVVPPRPPTVPQGISENSNRNNNILIPDSTPVLPTPNGNNNNIPHVHTKEGYPQRTPNEIAAERQQQQQRRAAAQQQPTITTTVTLQKKVNEGLGIKILSSYDDTYDEPPINGHTNNNNDNNNRRRNARIYVTKIEPNSVAHYDGQIEKDDVLLAVNDMPLTGLTHQQAARTIQSASEASNGRLRFQVAKHG